MFKGRSHKSLPAFFVEYLDDSVLSPFGRFLRDGGAPLRIINCPSVVVVTGDPIIVLGGYLGDSSKDYMQRFPEARVVIFEPIPKFWNKLQHDKELAEAQLYPVAAWVDAQGLMLAVDDDSTGIFATGENQPVQSVDFAEFLDGLETRPALLEINIEGAEYTLMEHFLTKSKNLPKTIFVQFHRVSDTSQRDREKIQNLLLKNYKPVFSYDWVWERWDIKN